jgi:hypothetical protein
MVWLFIFKFSHTVTLVNEIKKILYTKEKSESVSGFCTPKQIWELVSSLVYFFFLKNISFHFFYF